MDRSYLQPHFDAKSLKVSQLRNILNQHDVAYLSNAKKSQLLKLFHAEVYSHRDTILEQLDNDLKVEHDGIIDMTKSKRRTTKADKSDRSMEVDTVKLEPETVLEVEPSDVEDTKDKESTLFSDKNIFQSPASRSGKKRRGEEQVKEVKKKGKVSEPEMKTVEAKMEPEVVETKANSSVKSPTVSPTVSPAAKKVKSPKTEVKSPKSPKTGKSPKVSHDQSRDTSRDEIKSPKSSKATPIKGTPKASSSSATPKSPRSTPKSPKSKESPALAKVHKSPPKSTPKKGRVTKISSKVLKLPESPVLQKIIDEELDRAEEDPQDDAVELVVETALESIAKSPKAPGPVAKSPKASAQSPKWPKIRSPKARATKSPKAQTLDEETAAFDEFVKSKNVPGDQVDPVDPPIDPASLGIKFGTLTDDFEPRFKPVLPGTLSLGEAPSLGAAMEEKEDEEDSDTEESQDDGQDDDQDDDQVEHQKSPKSKRSILPILTYVVTWLVVSSLGLFAYWYREQTFLVGYCGQEIQWSFHSPSFSPQVNAIVNSYLDTVKPACVPCPPHARCFPYLEIGCFEDFIESKPWYYDVAPFISPRAKSCVPDTKKAEKLEIMIDVTLDILRSKNAAVNCGNGLIGEAGMSKTDLYDILVSLKAPYITMEEFDELWERAIVEVEKEPEIVRQVYLNWGWNGARESWR